MNSVVRKVLLVLAITFGIYTAVLYAFVRLVVVRSFNDLQVADATAETERCRLIVNKEVTMVRNLCDDWGTWDDACKFIEDRNAEFVKSTLDYAVFKLNRLSAVVFTDVNGNIVWSKSYDLATGKETVIPELSQEQLLKNPMLYSHGSVDSTRAGIVLMGEYPVIISSSPIITSRRVGPVRGALIMARILSKEDIRYLGESLGTSFRLVPVREAGFTPAAGRDYAVQRLGRDRIGVSTAVNDIFDRPTMALVADVPAPISSRGKWVGALVSFSVVAAGILTLVMTFMLLNRLVMGRLHELGKAIEDVAAGDDSSEAAGQEDELARHTDMVMRVVERLDDTEHALDASYQRFWSAFFNAPFPIMIHDGNGKVLQINRRWTLLTGYTHQDIPTVDLWCRKAADSEPALLRKALIAGRRTEDLTDEPDDIVIKTKEGASLVWTFSTFVLVKGEQGRQQIISMALDITDRHRAQQTLRDNESLFRSLTESIPAVTYLAEVTPEALFIYVSPQSKSFFGLTAQELRNVMEPWRLIISDEHYRNIMETRHTTVTQKRHFVAEYHGRSRDGEALALHEEAHLVTTVKGPMIQGVIFDVSGSRQLDIKIGSVQAN
jgi:PAS domain S-box-containing protein